VEGIKRKKELRLNKDNRKVRINKGNIKGLKFKGYI